MADDDPSFYWKSLLYKAQLSTSGSPTEIGGLVDLQKLIATGKITDATVLEVEGETGTLQMMKETYLGFANAILMNVDGALAEIQRVTEDMPEYWAVQSYNYNANGNIGIVSMYELQKMMVAGQVDDGTMIYTDEFAAWTRFDVMMAAHEPLAEALMATYPDSVWCAL